MKKLFQFFISIRFINRIGRNVLSKFIIFSKWIKHNVALRWVIYGSASFKIAGVRFKLFSNGDDGLATRYMYDHGGERIELYLLSILAPKFQTMLDIGANTGVLSIIPAIVNKKINIHAFEPVKPNFVRLQKNIKLNNLNNITAIKKAVGETNKKLSFEIPADGSISTTVSALKGYIEAYDYGSRRKYIEERVEQITVDDYIDEFGLTDVNFLKIDVELLELQVLKGAKKTIEKHKPLVMCEVVNYEYFISKNDDFKKTISPNNHRLIEDYFKSMNYYFYVISEQGLIRLEDTSILPFYRNVIFSTKLTKNKFISLNDTKTILSLL